MSYRQGFAYIFPLTVSGLWKVMLMLSLGSCLMARMAGGELARPEERLWTGSEGGERRGLQASLYCTVRNW